MNGYLLDTNIICELRKKKRADSNVVAWFKSIDADQLFLSVLVIGELRKGIELARRSDPQKARSLERWLEGLLLNYAERLLPVTSAIAARWGELSAMRPVSVVDGLMAATALESQLTLVTRNTRDVEHTGVLFLNPFQSQSST